MNRRQRKAVGNTYPGVWVPNYHRALEMTEEEWASYQPGIDALVAIAAERARGIIVWALSQSHPNPNICQHPYELRLSESTTTGNYTRTTERCIGCGGELMLSEEWG